MKNLKGIAIRKARKELGLTQVNVAKLCRVTNTYIRMVETGCVNPTDFMMSKILESFGIWIITKEFLNSLMTYPVFPLPPKKC